MAAVTATRGLVAALMARLRRSWAELVAGLPAGQRERATAAGADRHSASDPAQSLSRMANEPFLFYISAIVGRFHDADLADQAVAALGVVEGGNCPLCVTARLNSLHAARCRAAHSENNIRGHNLVRNAFAAYALCADPHTDFAGISSTGFATLPTPLSGLTRMEQEIRAPPSSSLRVPHAAADIVIEYRVADGPGAPTRRVREVIDVNLTAYDGAMGLVHRAWRDRLAYAVHTKRTCNLARVAAERGDTFVPLVFTNLGTPCAEVFEFMERFAGGRQPHVINRELARIRKIIVTCAAAAVGSFCVKASIRPGGARTTLGMGVPKGRALVA